MNTRLTGLLAATHTPTNVDGTLNLEPVQRLADHLIADGCSGAFVAGTTGECHSFNCQERIDLATRWTEVAAGTELKVVIHVGANALPDACQMAAHAQQAGADAIATMAPFFFKPTSVDALLDYIEPIAQAAADTPLYFYDIPSMTGVHLSMVEMLEKARSRVPSLRGMKYTNADLMQMQRCMHVDDGYFDVLFGHDPALAAGWRLGIRGAVGSTYNFAAPIYTRLIEAIGEGDEAELQRLQLESCKLTARLFEIGFHPASRQVMARLGIDLGPPRTPLVPLTADQVEQLDEALAELDFDQWRR
ncbi:MAG: dihydrodipicolinate synthase family protein [Pirellulaceae bacterium]